MSWILFLVWLTIGFGTFGYTSKDFGEELPKDMSREDQGGLVFYYLIFCVILGPFATLMCLMDHLRRKKG